MNSFYSLLSRRFSNWSYASSRIYESPFSWIDSGPRPGFESARPPAYVAGQLAAFKKWGMGREFANFAYKGLKGFDYTPYLGAMQAASVPSVVDFTPPGLDVTLPARGSSYETTEDTVDLSGTAVDDLAVRLIRWKNQRGGEGAARMTWKILSGDYTSGYHWQMDWTIPGIPLKPGSNAIMITVEDIKGLTSSRTVTVKRK